MPVNQASGTATATTATGPSSSQSPYVVPLSGNVHIESILSVGDQVGFKDGPANAGQPWRMAGIPDGLGAYDNGDGTMTVLMNHELRQTDGLVRDHGQTGAFISQLTIDTGTLAVTAADDLIQDVFFYDRAQNLFVEDVPYLGTAQIGRLCSADLPEISAFYDASTGLGTQDRIFLSGEEIGAEGRVFAHVATGAEAGNSYELPHLGRFSWENALANPASGPRTVVVGLDDSNPGEVYVYVGDRSGQGNAAERAGLVGGDLYGIAASFGDDAAATPGQGTFQLVAQGNNGDVGDTTGTELQAQSGPLTQFGRPEDGAWDPTNPNRFYFLTTGTSTVPTRLWALDFVDVERPELGGSISAVVEGGLPGSNDPNVPVMLDNMTVTESGLVVMQEDPGNSARLARIWIYDPNADTQAVGGTSGLTAIAQHDPQRFSFAAGPNATPAPGTTSGFGQDEESSGIIDVTSLLGDGDRLAFLFDTQAHYTIDTDPNTPGVQGEFVEGGQLMAMYYDLPNPGDDRFSGGKRGDRYDGGFGADSVNGRQGNDVLFGNYGDDRIEGGPGNDSLDGGPGADALSGDRGDDRLAGGPGDDRLDGGDGRDHLDGGVGNDLLDGGKGADMLVGGFGNDRLRGGADADTLLGNQGTDSLDGGPGSDVLDGGSGADSLTGDAGADIFRYLDPRDGGDAITDFRSGQDRILLDFDVVQSQVRYLGFQDSQGSAGAGPTLLYAGTTGSLFYDPTGTGGGASDQVLIATLGSSPALYRADVMFV